MKTIISDDHLGRFAEVDHTVLDELQVMLEGRAQPDAGTNAGSAVRYALGAMARGLRWFGDWQDHPVRSA